MLQRIDVIVYDVGMNVFLWMATTYCMDKMYAMIILSMDVLQAFGFRMVRKKPR